METGVHDVKAENTTNRITADLEIGVGRTLAIYGTLIYPGLGSVTSIPDGDTNGVSWTVANRTTVPAFTFSLGVITPSSVAATGNVTGLNLSGTNTGDQTTITGNAGTATALQTSRTIGGSAFDGTANVTSFPSPGAIGSTTPDTGAFTALSATGVISVSGEAAIRFNSADTNYFFGPSGNASLSGQFNTGLGRDTLISLTSGSDNTGIGLSVLRSLTTGIYNVGMGSDSMYDVTTASNNVTLGVNALRYNVTGDNNVAIGTLALQGVAANSPADNVAIGTNSMRSLTTGTFNFSAGKDSMYAASTAGYNTACGANSLRFLTTGTSNTASGYATLYSVSTGGSNTAIGGSALSAALGSGNVALGYFAGAYETGSNAFYIDNQDRTNTAGDKAGAILYGTFNATPSSQTLKINAGTTSAIGDISAGANLVAQSGGLFVGSGGKQIYLRTVSGVNRIDSYDNPITGTIALNINALNMTFQIADSTRAYLDSTGLAVTGIITATTDIESTTIGSGFILKSPDSTRWRITISNAGALITTSI